MQARRHASFPASTSVGDARRDTAATIRTPLFRAATFGLRDLAGRARRLVVAVVVGFAASHVSVRLASRLQLGNDDTGPRDFGLLGFALAAGVGCFALALVVLNRRALIRWQTERVPRARVR